MPDLQSLSRGFRARYLDHAELRAQLSAWADAWPDLCRIETIGQTGEGRPIEVLVLGPDADRPRPGIWVSANMHAAELCGSSVALAFAEDVLRLHLGEEPESGALPGHLADLVKDVLVYVLPRVTPDGADAVLQTGAYVRSVPRDTRPQRNAARWVAADIDGDGEALLMRVADPSGDMVESAEFPGLMVPREPEDPGPWYRVWPEGVVEGGDGHAVPDPNFLSDNQTDLNRNFPWSWQPEPHQAGAGAYPGCEPESAAILAFTATLPHLFAWIDLHSFGGVFIRPLGHKPDTAMEPQDLALFRQLEVWADRFTGYPMVSGFEQFTYSPDTPLHGDLVDYAMHARGALTYVVELWDLFEQAGLPRRGARFVDRYSHLDREDLVALARWDRDHNEGRCLRPWRPTRHPQLGEVEVGGLDPRFGIWNPPPDRLGEVCAAQAQVMLRVASLAPRIVLDVDVDRVGPDLHEITVVVRNEGYLPTYILATTRSLPLNEPLWAAVRADGGAEVLGDRRIEVGHLEGWGRGRFSGGSALYFQRSRGATGVRRLRWTVRGSGAVTVEVRSCRTGTRAVTVEVP